MAGLASLVALQEAQKLSSGVVWLVLFTVQHPQMPAPLYLVSPSFVSVNSRGKDYLPSRFDVEFPSESFESTGRARIVMDGVSGVILNALQSLPSSPTFTIEVVLESDLDTVQLAISDLEIEASVRTEGANRLSAELTSSRFAQLPFPGINMDRARVSGIFTDIA